jgi:two-component system, NarL family, response regulator LiaR
MTESLQVIVIDDHRMFADGVDILLSGEPDIQVAGVFNTGEEAVSNTRQACPDVVLMDIDLPGMDGIEATKRILERCPEARVVVVTAFQQSKVMVKAIEAGACGFLPKVRAANELVKVIRLAAAGEMVLPSTQFAEVFSDLRWAWERAKDARPDSALTDREVAVLQAFAEGKSTVEVARELSVSVSTVHSYMKKILAKLGVHSKLQAVMLAIREGIVHVDSESMQDMTE